MTQVCAPCGLRCRLCSRTRASAFVPPPVGRGRAFALIRALPLPGAGKRQRPEQEPSARPTPNETRGPRAGRRVCACARVRASRARGDGRHVGAAARGAVRRRGLPHPAQVRPRDPQSGAKARSSALVGVRRESRACVLACTFVSVRARLSCCVHACMFVFVRACTFAGDVHVPHLLVAGMCGVFCACQPECGCVCWGHAHAAARVRTRIENAGLPRHEDLRVCECACHMRTQIKLFVQRHLSNTLTVGTASKSEVGFRKWCMSFLSPACLGCP